nr:MAG TPA: hypothetical protein [Bacteriophage sp.]DAW75802.1 MAG TPA: hypothetical protein [Crassvirales sp.]
MVLDIGSVSIVEAWRDYYLAFEFIFLFFVEFKCSV